MVVDKTGLDVRVKFGDTSTRSRDIRLAHFGTDERTTTPAYAGHYIRPKRQTVDLPKNKSAN